MRTRLFGLFILLLIVVILSIGAMAETVGDYYDLKYTVSNGENIIIKCSNSARGELIIPAEIAGRPVTRIQGSAFYGCSGLTRITIPSSVTSIEQYTFFQCRSLTSIEIPSSVTSIGRSAFYGCSSLTSIEIPSSVTSIGDEAFFCCSSLTSIEIPSSVPSIGYQAFYGCTSLTSVEIPASVTSIGDEAFYYCSSLDSITIWNANCSIDNSAYTISQGTIYGRSGSTAQTYADTNGRAFVVATCAHPAVYRDALVETPATCTEAGSRTYSCMMCGDEVEEVIPALGHDYVVTTTAKAPTCTASGIGRYTCTRCEATKIDSIPATGHTEVEIPAVAATCTTNGATAGVKCAVCNEIFTAPTVIPATGHTEVEIPAVPATCTTDGATAGVRCSVCNAILTAPTVIPALGHSEVALAAVPASCTESGLTAGVKCSVCNEILVAQEIIPALGHDYQITETYLEATCTEAGIAAYTCTRCGDVKYDDIPKVSALALSGVYTNGEGDLRFVTRVNSTAGDPEIEYFGTYIVPLSYFTANALTASADEQVGVGTVKYTQNIESGKTFAADLCNIPTSAYGAPIFAWSFIKFKGINDICVQTLGSFTVNEATLVKGGF